MEETSPSTHSENTSISPTRTSIPTLTEMISHPVQHPMQTRPNFEIRKPRYLFNLNHSMSSNIPTCASKAALIPQWRQAMADEYTILMHNKMWILSPSHPSLNLVGCKWIFRIKEKLDGSIKHYKAHLVAQGYKQQHDIDYDETFSAIIKPQTVQTVLSFALSSNWHIRQLDVRNVFIHDHLNELFYIKQPPRFIHPSTQITFVAWRKL